MTRTFIALEMHAAVQHNLKELIHQVAHALPGVRWVDPASIHLTLAFLDELDDKRLTMATQAALEAAQRCGSFSYQLGSLGIFGSIQQPRFIWIGVEEPAGMLLRVHSTLKQALEKYGFETEARFSPHLTLARLKAPLSSNEQQQLELLLANKQLVSSERYQVGAIEVF